MTSNNGRFQSSIEDDVQADDICVNGDSVCSVRTSGIRFRVMEYNVENLFDAVHDSLKDDFMYLPDGAMHWTKSKFWHKLNAVARGVVLSNTDSMQNFNPPALIGLCEVENDSCVYALTHRSLLKAAGYDYIITHSQDERGVDVALLYQPVMFRPDTTYSLYVDTIPGMRKTRDILYVRGVIRMSEKHNSSSSNPNNSSLNPNHSPLHVFVVHAPSRLNGERITKPYRRQVLNRLMLSVDSVQSVDNQAKIIVMGDFNDYSDDDNLLFLGKKGMVEVSKGAHGANNRSVKGTYQYKGQWDSLDHIFVSETLKRYFTSASVADHPDLLEPDANNGGVKPKRFVVARKVNYGGYSDHLPLLCDFEF